jgi:hypothetical protein
MTAINRPWLSSFPFATAPFSETQLEQLYKLTRNFVASLDMGCPNVKHVVIVGWNESTKGLDERQKYLLWVKSWKVIYREVSQLIRRYKTYRKTIHFPKFTAAEEEQWFRSNGGINESYASFMNGMAEKHLSRLQETAMVMLNARYNAKLASAERRRRNMTSST